MCCKIIDAINIIEEFAPISLQADFDNSGLICGDIHKELTGALITLDTNEEVVEEAINNGCNLIIEHHPTIFYPIQRIDYRLPLHKALVKAIKNDIVIYACHTNMDFTKNGLNDYVAKKLELEDIYCLNGDITSARIGSTKASFTLGEYANKVKTLFNDNNILTIGDQNKTVNKVAVINGGGAGDVNLLLELEKEGVDIFITGDIKYAFARFAKDYNYGIINFGHYDSEICFTELVYNILKTQKKDIKIIKTNKCKNPYNNRR